MFDGNSEIHLTELQFSNFENKIDRSGDCHVWKACKFQGYGKFGVKPRKSPMMAHRLAFLIRHKEIPEGMLVCHRCDNPSCVNPDHLFLGTYKDNVADMIMKGRANPPKGLNHHKAKLNKRKVNKIRELHLAGNTNREISKRFKVHEATILQVVTGITWKHVL